MAKRIDTLMALLRYAVCGTAPADSVVASAAAELEPLYQIAAHHDVAHLLSDALWKCGAFSGRAQDVTVQKLQRSQMAAIYRHEQLNAAFSTFASAMEAVQIPYLPLKGTVLCDLWPEPWMRTRCDMDILVHEADLPRVVGCLTETCGYQRKGRSAHDELLLSPEGIHLELHFNTIEQGRAGKSGDVLCEIWQHAQPVGNTTQYALDSDFFYFYHIAHMAKHFEDGGCGIRPFFDLWLLNHKVDCDAKGRDALLQRGGLLKFATACTQLSEVWLSNAAPTELSATLQRFILTGGVYGNLDNMVAVQRQQEGGALGYVGARLFWPYHRMRDKYPILRRRPYLLPVMHLRRFFEMVSDGRIHRTTRELKLNRSVSPGRQQEINALLDQLEL